MRLIDADVLKEMVPTTSVDFFENCRNCSLLYKEQVMELIDMTPTVDMWIPCSERLPEEEKKTYWVCTDTEYQCECRWTNNRFGIGVGEWGWSIFDTPQYSKPIAWMPLPDPYKEVQE